MNLRMLLIAASVAGLAGCAPEPGSEKWCASKKAQPESEWSMDDATTYAKHCLLDSSTVGSEAWCEKVREKRKGDWTADEAASYAKHCVM